MVSVASRKVAVAGVIVRVFAAAAGGYGLTSATTVWLSFALPLSQDEAATVAMLLSFAIMTGAILWAFTADTVAQAWAGLAVPAVLIALAAWFLSGGGASG